MAVRAFNGTNAHITLSIGDIVNSGAVTMLVLCNRTAGGGWRSTVDISSGTTQRLGMQASDAGQIHYISGVSFPTTNVAWGTAEGWVIVGISKASGTAAVRGHKYVFSTDTWTRNNGSSIANSTQGDTVRLGEMASFGEFFAGRMAAAAVWSRAMSDGEMDGLVADIQSWLDATPDALWLLTQESTATAVEDVTGGGADQTAITGTTVVTDDDPPGFDLEPGGGGTIDADADLTITANIDADAELVEALFVIATITADAEVVPPSGDVITATAALTTDATITADALVVRPADATLTATATITADATVIRHIDVSVTATGNVATDAAVAGMVTADATITAIGTVAAGAAVSVATAAELTVTVTITATAAIGQPEPITDLHFIALAPELTHGTALAPELTERTALAPELAHAAVGAPETVVRSAGQPELGHGDSGEPELAHGQPEVELTHGPVGEPTT